MTLPPKKERMYPSEEQIAFIGASMFNAAGGVYASCVEDFVHAICDWQAHQCREQVARWMLERSYATGHGDTIEDLLGEIEAQCGNNEDGPNE